MSSSGANGTVRSESPLSTERFPGRVEAGGGSPDGGVLCEQKRKLCVVIKVGSSSLVTTVDDRANKETFLSLNRISATIETICELRRAGHNVALVSSGAVGTGCHCLGLTEKPSNMTLATRQALAAIGQVHLMGKYESLFAAMRQNCAQVSVEAELSRLNRLQVRYIHV